MRAVLGLLCDRHQGTAHLRHQRGDLQRGVVRVGDRRRSRGFGETVADAAAGQRLAQPVGVLLVDHRRERGVLDGVAGTSTLIIWEAGRMAFAVTGPGDSVSRACRTA